MQTLVEIGLRNALLAVPLALAALLIGRWFKRPALTHAFWLLVLIRLLLPPLWHVQMPVAFIDLNELVASSSDSFPNAEQAPQLDNRDRLRTERHEVPLAANEGIEPAETGVLNPTPPPAIDARVGADDASSAVTADIRGVDSGAQPSLVDAVSSKWKEFRVLSSKQILAFVGQIWLLGSFALLAVTIVRVVCFHLVLRRAVPANAMTQHEMDALAHQLGLSRAPQLAFAFGRISPLLWNLGRTRLIVPAGLWETLDQQRRDALVTHELAHFKRGDHWVRWLEAVATLVFWWHPVLWVARTQLREAEEQCCDAWVIWALPAARRSYAFALMDTVDFLSEGRSSLPALASGIGRVRHLRRRLTMIMCGNTPRRLPRLGLAGLMTAGLAFGTLGISFAQDAPRPREPQERRGDDQPGAGRRDGDRSDDFARERNRLQAELERARAELDRARADLERAQRRVEEFQRRIIERAGAVPPGEGPNAPRGAGGPGGFPGMPGRAIPAGPGMPGAPGMAPPGVGFGGGARRGGDGASVEQRLQNLETNMQRMMQMLEDIQRGQSRPAGPRGSGSGRPVDPAPGQRPVPVRPPAGGGDRAPADRDGGDNNRAGELPRG
jgi:beta-lactamase regulating signal transducer with metallopeptidase domain